MLTRRRFLLTSGAALLVARTASASTGTTNIGGNAFGSYWQLSVTPEGAVKAARAGLGAIIDAVDQGFSPYRADSVLSMFNRNANTDWQAIRPDVHQVLQAGLNLATTSMGAFDPTVGPAVARFGFGPITGAMGHFNEITLTPEAVRKARPGLSIDLCGIAKGYALDLMAARLADAGIEDFLLDLGGELVSCGTHPSGRPWQVAIDAPGGGLTEAFALSGQAVATSGTTIQAYHIGQKTFGHIIDPLTGKPSASGVVSVSVLAQTGMAADGWATALMAMPEQKALATARQQGLDALFLVARDNGFEPVALGNFAQHLLG